MRFGRPGQIGGAEGVAIQRRAVEGRLVQRCGHILGQGPAQRVGPGDHLHAQRGDAVGQEGDGLLQ